MRERQEPPGHEKQSFMVFRHKRNSKMLFRRILNTYTTCLRNKMAKPIKNQRLLSTDQATRGMLRVENNIQGVNCQCLQNTMCWHPFTTCQVHTIEVELNDKIENNNLISYLSKSKKSEPTIRVLINDPKSVGTSSIPRI